MRSSSLIFCILSVSFWLQSQENRLVFDINSSDKDITITTFRFYITNVKIHLNDGTELSEATSNYLVDLDKEGSNVIDLSSFWNEQVQEIEFTIGTDSLTNVSGALDGALDPIHGMYWAWNSGYINFKIEGYKRVDQTQQLFEYHIGGYATPFGTARIFKASFDAKYNGEIRIKVDLIQYLKTILNDGSVHSILIPGREATQKADLFQTFFSLEK